MIEKEKKFVLLPDFERVWDAFGKKMDMTGSTVIQLYLEKNSRIRKRITDSRTDYTFTYKQPIGNDSMVEIETSITEDDYMLLKDFAKKTLTKCRYTHKENNVVWDLDVFLDNSGEPYFILLEIEYDDFFPNLTWLDPDLLLLEVKNNAEFSSYKLADHEYTKEKLQEIKYVRKGA